MCNFQEIESRWGHVAAYSCLLEIEKAAHISPLDVMGIDPETRFENACRIQDETSFLDTAHIILGQAA